MIVMVGDKIEYIRDVNIVDVQVNMKDGSVRDEQIDGTKNFVKCPKCHEEMNLLNYIDNDLHPCGSKEDII